MRLSVCKECGSQLLDNDQVYLTGVARIKLADPMVGIDLEAIESLEHLECPKH